MEIGWGFPSSALQQTRSAAPISPASKVQSKRKRRDRSEVNSRLLVFVSLVLPAFLVRRNLPELSTSDYAPKNPNPPKKHEKKGVFLPCILTPLRGCSSRDNLRGRRPPERRSDSPFEAGVKSTAQSLGKLPSFGFWGACDLELEEGRSPEEPKSRDSLEIEGRGSDEGRKV